MDNADVWLFKNNKIFKFKFNFFRMMKMETKLKRKVKVANKMMKWMHNKVLDHPQTSLIMPAELPNIMFNSSFFLSDFFSVNIV